MSEDVRELRLDVWLYRARLLKTRSKSADIVEKGKVRLTRHNETRRIKKPGFRVSEGDLIAFMRGPTLFQVEILSCPHRRGPAKEARETYRIIDIQTCDTNDS